MTIRCIRTTCYCILHIVFFGSLAAAKSEIILHELLATTPQEFTYLIQDVAQLDQPVVAYDPDEVQKNFLAYYFAPWHHPLAFFSLEALGKKEKDKLEKCCKNPIWGSYKHQYPRDFIKSIGNNATPGYPL